MDLDEHVANSELEPKQKLEFFAARFTLKTSLNSFQWIRDFHTMAGYRFELPLLFTVFQTPLFVSRRRRASRLQCDQMLK